ncbi:transforming growth factor-beta-induced protein ig-h3 [Octopus sinensis]|uniref:Transforming growth factor-beta-induced protein ig-h3 n=1 Tax=Octopus sinensis TaxID=2607531 RepID=A0A6P7SQT6_9MOLL|nr:transforming growth factor-beta-induced protein ig-h3 [Octopus sinensis]XP_036361479.1 transforming growth factor-beta-induced protein ig-h3 [Octopus sinensis]
MHCTISLVLLLTTVTSNVLTLEPDINYSKLDNMLDDFRIELKNFMQNTFNRRWLSETLRGYSTSEKAYDIVLRLNATLFLKLLKKANLDSILKNPNSKFTIFAPTNEGLMKLPDKIKKNSTLMNSILRFHLVSDYRTTSSFINNDFIKTIAKYGVPPKRRSLNIRTNIYSRLASKIITASGSKILNKDNSNGLSVVHLIDGLMFPLPVENAYDEILRQPKFSILRRLVSKSYLLIRVLSETNQNFTIFAPTNEAFNNLPAGTLKKLENNVPLLTQTLVKAFISNIYYKASFMDGMNLIGIAQNTIQLTFHRHDFIISDGETRAKISGTDFSVLNGVIHSIDNILLKRDNTDEIIG